MQKINYEVLHKTEKNLSEFYKIYELDRLAARVYSLTKEVSEEENVVFHKGNKEFDMVKRKRKHSVASTLKHYCSEKIENKFIIKPKSFYKISNKSAIPLTWNMFNYDKFFIDYFEKQYHQFLFLKENHINISFNSVVKNKLYNLKDCLRYIYKTNYPNAKILHQYRSFFDGKCKNYFKSTIGLLNINEELFNLNQNEDLLRDSIQMAYKLNKKIDLSWSVKRLNKEHDDMSYEISKILQKCNNKNLNIKENYLNFSNHSSIEIIKTTGDLTAEGILQHHCVANYESSINNGNCAIFRYKGYTLEIGNIFGSLHLNQARGKYNCTPPNEILEEIDTKIKNYNETIARNIMY